MTAIQRITPLTVWVFKDVRLRALEDSPHAFDSTYRRESLFPDSEWLRRVERWNGEKGVGFMAMDGETACGIAGCFLDQKDAARAELVSMWTAPTHRQKGIGRLLVEEVLNWARLGGARSLFLMVTSNNEPAIRFYERLGFRKTGRTEPYPNDSSVVEYEMSRAIP